MRIVDDRNFNIIIKFIGKIRRIVSYKKSEFVWW